MASRRRYVLGAALALSGLVAAAILVDVLATVFFAITVAYLLSPVRRRLIDRGLTRWSASAVATTVAFLAVVATAAPLVVVIFLRLELVLSSLGRIPREVTVELLGLVHTVTLEEALVFVQSVASTLAQQAATAVPVLAIKLTLFALLVFSLLYNEERLRVATISVVPYAYRDVVVALHRRTRETLFAIYVLQAATAVGTFLIALPVFYVLGYAFPFALATVAAVLQFVPIVGPSILVAGLAAFHLAVSELPQAVAVALLGGVLVAWLPDILIRPRLASETAHLPGGLYFTGFVGGLLTLGPVGVIAGPLAVALVVEVASLLSSELNDVPVRDQ